MNTTKARMMAISLLDRAFAATSDDDLAALVAALPEDHLTALRHIAGIRDASDTDGAAGDDADAASGEGAGTGAIAPADMVADVRAAGVKGRINADLERIAVLLTDACLAECIEKLGDHADLPSHDDLMGVIPGLVETHGVPTVRLMLASVVAGDAPAAPTIVKILKTDEFVKLPPVEARAIAPVLPPRHDDEERARLKAQRKERKAAEQAAARLRREQAARARRG